MTCAKGNDGGAAAAQYAKLWHDAKDQMSTLEAELAAIKKAVPWLYPEEFPVEGLPCPSCKGEGVHGAIGYGGGVTEVDCRHCDTLEKRLVILGGLSEELSGYKQGDEWFSAGQGCGCGDKDIKDYLCGDESEQDKDCFMAGYRSERYCKELAELKAAAEWAIKCHYTTEEYSGYDWCVVGGYAETCFSEALVAAHRAYLKEKALKGAV